MAKLTIADVRGLYPQYNDMGDQELARALHQRFYADMPESTVFRELGLDPTATAPIPQPRATQAAPSTPAAAQPPSPVPSPMPPMQGPQVPPAAPQGMPKAGNPITAILDSLTAPARLSAGQHTGEPMDAPAAAPAEAPSNPIFDFLGNLGQQAAAGAGDALAGTPGVLATGQSQMTSPRGQMQRQIDEARSQISNLNMALAAAPASEQPAIITRIEALQGMVRDLSAQMATADQTPTVPRSQTPAAGVEQQIIDAIAGRVGAPDPNDTSLVGQVFRGLGNVGGMLVQGPMGALAGAGMNQRGVYEDAIANGADEATANEASQWGSLVGVGEIVPIFRAFKFLPKKLRGEITNKGMKRVAQLLQAAAEEGGQEGVAGILNNWIAQGYYDPERGFLDDVGEQVLVGAIVGGTVNVAGQALDAATAPRPVPQERGLPSPDAFALPAPQDAQPQAQPAQDAETTAPPVAAPVPAVEPQREDDDEIQTDADGRRFIDMDESETEDGESTPTGRRVRFYLDDGRVEVIQDEAAPAPAQPTESPAQVGAQGDAEGAVDVGSPAPSDQDQGQQTEAEREAERRGMDAIGADDFDIEILGNDQVQQVQTDAKTFQYKDGGDQDGVTERLQGINKWDVTRAGMSLVYEYEDGRRFIADGHQRLGLAKNLAPQGQRIQMPAIIIRQRDGYSPEDARNIAALKNIAEGSGTAIDAAKVLRSDPGQIDSLNLPPKSAMVRDAKGLAVLSDDAFGMVVNDVASVRDGAIVGRVVKDKDLQPDILALLGRIKPSNEFQAEQIARNAAADSQTETQDTLFGPETTQQSLYGERAKVLDGAMKGLARRRNLANLLVDREGAITSLSPTNQLDTETNQQEADRTSRAQAYLQRQANVKGPISDALTQAARRVKDNPKQLGNAVTDFLKAVQSVADGAQPDRQQGGAAGPDVQPAGGDRPGAAPEGQAQGVSPEPQTERTPEGEQTLIPGVAPITDGDRLQTQANRPMTGTDRGPGSGRDDLFGNPEDRQDLFDRPQQEAAPAATAPEPEAPRDPQRGKFDGTVTRSWSNFVNMKDEFPGLDPDNLGDSARDYVLTQGRKARAEVLILIDDQGRVKAVGRGKRASVGVPTGLPDTAMVAHHNHPRSTALSPNDITMLSKGNIRVVYAYGHKGQIFRAELTPAGAQYLGGDWQRALGKMTRIREIFSRDYMNALTRLHSELVQGGMTTKDATKAVNWHEPWFQHRMMIALARAGVIHYDYKLPEAMMTPNPAVAQALDRAEQTAISTIKEGMPDAVDRQSRPERRPGDLAGFPVRNATALERGHGLGREGADPRGNEGGEGVSDLPGRTPDRQDVDPDPFDAAGDELFGPQAETRNDFDAAGDELFGPEDAPQERVPFGQSKPGDMVRDGVWVAARRVKNQTLAKAMARHLKGFTSLDGKGSTSTAVMVDYRISADDATAAMQRAEDALQSLKDQLGDAFDLSTQAARKAAVSAIADRMADMDSASKPNTRPIQMGPPPTPRRPQEQGQYDQGVVGQKLKAGQRVYTSTGRLTSPFPKLDFSSERKTQNTVRRADRWLMDNARDEAEARGDTFNQRQFEANAGRPSQSDKDSAELYLFDPDFVTGPTPSITRPLSRPARTPSKADDAQSLNNLFKEGGPVLREDGINDDTYQKAVPIFARNVAGLDLSALSDKDAFVAMARPLVAQGLTRDAYNNMRPYFERFLSDVRAGRINPESDDATAPGNRVEPDRGDPDAPNGVGPRDVPLGRRGNRNGDDAADGGADAGAGRPAGGRVPDGDAAPVGGTGNPRRPGGRRSPRGQRDGDGNRAGSGNRREPGLRPDDQGTEATRSEAADAPGGVIDKAGQTAKTTFRAADPASIAAAVPALRPEQVDDVVRIEKRFFKPDEGKKTGLGMLITNGTGTGKTFTHGGTVKRFLDRGAKGVLVVVPAKDIPNIHREYGILGIETTELGKAAEDVDADARVIVTSYEKLRSAKGLADREWDLIVADESHQLSMNKDGNPTDELRMLRALSNHPTALIDKALHRRRKELEAADKRAGDNSELRGKLMAPIYEAAREEARKELAKLDRSRVLFLSATPFAYDKSTDYASGYLFDYPQAETREGSRQDGRVWFMVQNFGYRVRYHKLTRPDAAVDTGVFERQFHEKLKGDGALWGRQLDVEPDYDRKFAMIENELGTKLDNALKHLSSKVSEASSRAAKLAKDSTSSKEAVEAAAAELAAWRGLEKNIHNKFSYLKRLQLLEAIKAQQAIPDIEQHIALGRKVVVFHDYKVGGGSSPFKGVAVGDDQRAKMAQLEADLPFLKDLDFGTLKPPMVALKDHFGAAAMLYNGDLSATEKNAVKDAFNDDDGAVKIVIAQSASGSQGWSGHDTTGKFQRVVIGLGMPTRPTVTIQGEGRIRRVGVVSDAIYRYYTIGTTWERQAFAGAIAPKSGTVENLALGDAARRIKDSFIEAYADADVTKPSKSDGKGGKAKDATDNTMTEFDRAKTFYFGRMKMRGNRQQRDGVDFFPTPEPLGLKMVQWAQVRPYEKVLEPSAGDGAIARWFPAHADRTIVEPSADLASRAELVSNGARKVERQFEDLDIVNKYDAIVMNPPFGTGGKTAYDHVQKAMMHTRPGGRIVALVPTGPAADKRFEKLVEGMPDDWHITGVYGLPPVTFERANTRVAAQIIVMDRTAPGQFPSGRGMRDISANTINDLFDRLEYIDAPDRPEPVGPTGVEAEMDAAGDPVAAPNGAPLSVGPDGAMPADDYFDVFEFEHTGTGAMQYGAQIKERLGDRYAAVAALARTHGGNYSRYQNRAAGAKRGFLFPSPEQRQAFMDDMRKPTHDGAAAGVGFAEAQAFAEGAPVFYSPLLTAVEGAKQAKAPAKDWKSIIAKLSGVKKAETDWLGVEQWLDMQDGQVTRDDLAAFIRDSQIEVVEDRLAGGISVDDLTLDVDYNNAVEPDWNDEADLYMDEARDEVEAEWAEYYKVDSLDGMDPEDVDRARIDREIMVRAKDLARERFTPEEYAADIGLDGSYPFTGTFHNMEGFTFPELDVYGGDEQAVLFAAASRISDDGSSGPSQFEDYTEEGGTNYREVLLRVPGLERSGRNKVKLTPEDQAAYDAAGREMARIEAEVGPVGYVSQSTPADSPKWQWEAAQAKRQEIASRYEGKSPFVNSAHFEQENIVVHARVKDRTGANGEKILFVEEIQSDLASAWRDNNEPAEVTARRRELQDRRNSLTDGLTRARLEVEREVNRQLERQPEYIWDRASMDGVPVGFRTNAVLVSALQDGLTRNVINNSAVAEEYRTATGEWGTRYEAFAAILAKSPDAMSAAKQWLDLHNQAREIENDLLAFGTEKRIDPTMPETPFRDPDQYALMVKRLLRMAADQGYDRLSWTPGYMQAERWNNAAQSVVEGVEWKPAPENQRETGATRLVHLNMSGRGKFVLWTDRAGTIVDASDGISSAVGKPLSALIGRAANDVLESDSGSMTGQKITFGDSGYAIAYDQHIRKAVEKLTKKHGAKPYQDRTLPDMTLLTDMDDARNDAIYEMGPVAFAEKVLAEANASGRKIVDRVADDMMERAKRAQSLKDGGDTMPGLTNVWAQINSIRQIAGNDLTDRVVKPQAVGSPVWSVDMTPDLRAAAMKPQAMFQRPRMEPGHSAMDPQLVQSIMPDLRAELDRLNLKRVRLGFDRGATWQGVMRGKGMGGIDIVIGQALDPKATLYHEAIHALKAMNLFTTEEWGALEVAAAKYWVEKHDIPARYPDLMPSEQIEEAIAEEFAAHAAAKTEPRGALLVRAYRKAMRILKAIRDTFTGRGFETPEKVFGKVLAGQIGARDAESSAAMLALNETAEKFQRRPLRAHAQQQAHSATAMAHPAHIPDRRLWDELMGAQASIWDRLRGTRGALHDKVDRARIIIQDRFLPVLRSQEAVMRQSGQPLPLQQDAYIAETTYSGKVGRHLFEIDEDYTKPIIDLIGATKGALTIDDIGTWLNARHARERNKYIASINPKMPDGGSGMTNAEAAQVMLAAQDGPHAQTLQKIGALVDKLRDRTLDLRLDAGLLTVAEHAMWKAQYKYYVPLKGFAETDHSEAMLDVTGTGRRFNTRGAESKRALGRQSLAFNPLQGAITQAQEVAVRAEKNRVGRALYELAKNNPSKELWEVKTPKQKRYFNRTTGMVETRVEDPVSLFMDPNELAVKVNGKEKRILFKDPRLARAAGSVGADQMGAIIKVLSMFSRYFSAINTMLNPVFVIANAFRDMTTAQINIRGVGGEDRNAIAASMIKNWPRAFAAALRGQGTADPGGEWGKWYREYEESGAKVSFWKLSDPEQDVNRIETILGDLYGGPLRRRLKYLRPSTSLNPILSGIERVNLSVDNAIRLAAYAEARKRGWSKPKAAALSKNLTVNFNRRGEVGATMNALFPFFNAAVQGTQVLFHALSYRRVQATVAGVIGIAIINDLVNAALSDEDDDGELAYDKIPDWKQQMNIVANWSPGVPDGANTIPLPYGYNVFWYGGTQLGKLGRGVKDAEEVWPGLFGAALTAFSPISGGNAATLLAPTFVDPVVEMVMNEDWLGRPIRPENPYSDFGPDAYKFYGGASEVSKWIADKANRATGGNVAESGWLDVSPEYIDHMAGFLTGGAGRFLGQSTDVAAKIVTGQTDLIETRDIPGANRVAYTTGYWLDVDRYYRFREQVNEARAQVKTYTDAGIPVPRDVRATAALNDAVRAADRQMRDLRDKREKVEASNLTAQEKRARREQITLAQQKVAMAFNKRYIKLHGRQGE